MAKDFQEVRQEILVMHQRLQEENYYELLGVEEGADSAMIGSRFRQLARSWHIDRFSSYDLGAEKMKVQEIFSVLNTAHRTLTNDETREEYDMNLVEGPDIAKLLEAESEFRAGKSRLEMGSYHGANDAFQKACLLKDDEPEYQAHLIFTEYLLIDKDENGRVLNRKRTKEIMQELDEIQSALQEKPWLLTFMGTVSLGIGNDGEAESLFQEALMEDSNNTDAKRMLRLIRSRRKNKQKKGFFAKLFGK